MEIYSADSGIDSDSNSDNTWCDIMYLSPHFRLREFTRSATAERLGICNEPGIDAISNLQRLCQQVLEPLREHAQQPVRISSGYRCRMLNKAVGGVRNSLHIKGKAADIAMPVCDANGRRLTQAEANAKLQEWYEWMRDHCPHEELILERGKPNSAWIHVAK